MNKIILRCEVSSRTVCLVFKLKSDARSCFQVLHRLSRCRTYDLLAPDWPSVSYTSLVGCWNQLLITWHFPARWFVLENLTADSRILQFARVLLYQGRGRENISCSGSWIEVNILFILLLYSGALTYELFVSLSTQHSKIFHLFRLVNYSVSWVYKSFVTPHRNALCTILQWTHGLRAWVLLFAVLGIFTS